MFWNKRKQLDSEEFVTLLKRIGQLEARVDYLEANEDNLRNLARKIQKARVKKDEDNETEHSNTSNVLIPV